jgi:hypothetical protein
MAPTQKKRMATRTIGRRPKMFDKDAKLGWKTASVLDIHLQQFDDDCLPVEDSRNDVPLQKASIAVPFKALAIVFI